MSVSSARHALPCSDGLALDVFCARQAGLSSVCQGHQRLPQEGSMDTYIGFDCTNQDSRGKRTLHGVAAVDIATGDITMRWETRWVGEYIGVPDE